MENYRLRFLWLPLGFFLLLLVCAKAENPLKNVNLAPFWQWRSAWDCLQNISTNCATNIHLNGVLNINGSALTDFCAGGCAEHTQNVLTCIYYAKRDFWFANGATVKNITETIHHGCSTNTSINTDFKSSAMRVYQNLLVPLVSSIATMLIVNIFHM
ncbi:uncharacterized protein LOC122722130 [Manihot esculenta]|uniref:Uncharacterized protein n=1 Tax=Manihot esculenta TaxID=3983 RepID=A0ACB7IA99_MANES|nr:uncharacterized protein LOC122722130 [Manihot esculenta]KAG8661149.1 hypothetical protein MANES_02G211000v8 [Manihot esculenta]